MVRDDREANRIIERAARDLRSRWPLTDAVSNDRRSVRAAEPFGGAK